MNIGFRKAVFNLCRKCMDNPSSKIIANLIHDISYVNDTTDGMLGSVKPSHGDFAYISSSNRIQFLGYLLTDESVELINKQKPFHVVPLSEDERKIMEMAYLTIQFFIDSCTKNMRQKYKKASILINPYLNYTIPRLKTDAESFLSSDDLDECVKEFESINIYRKLIENDALYFIENDEAAIRSIDAALVRQFSRDYSSVSNETKSIVYTLDAGRISTENVLMIYPIYCLALRKSIENAIQMLFEAITGDELIVLNNDNLISVDGEKKDLVYTRYTVLCQDLIFRKTGSNIGSLVCLDYDRNDNDHIKKFGNIYSETINMMGEFGQTSKMTIITVDDDLNPFYSLTNRILDSKIGSLKVINNKIIE